LPEQSKQSHQVESKLELGQCKRVQLEQNKQVLVGSKRVPCMGLEHIEPERIEPERIEPERIEPERIEPERSKEGAEQVAGMTGKADEQLCKISCIYPWVDNVLPTDKWHWDRPVK
jgi:hypothetical protein